MDAHPEEVRRWH